MCAFSSCMSRHHLCTAHEEVRRECLMPGMVSCHVGGGEGDDDRDDWESNLGPLKEQ